MNKSILTLVTLILTSGSFAATTGTLSLKGVVAEALSVSVTPEASALNLSLDTTTTDLMVASVLEQSNSKTGYKVSISSQNNGSLVHEDGIAVDSQPYTLKYDGLAVDPVLGLAHTQFVGDAYSVSRDVTVSYTGRAVTDMVAGEYSDTVTFSISAN